MGEETGGAWAVPSPVGSSGKAPVRSLETGEQSPPEAVAFNLLHFDAVRAVS